VIATWSVPFTPTHPIFDTLEHDHLFTQSDRLRVLAMAEAIPMFHEPERRKVIDPDRASPSEKGYYGLMGFLASINDYFQRIGYYGDPNHNWGPNLPRGGSPLLSQALVRLETG